MYKEPMGKYLSIAKRAHSMLLQKKLKQYNIGTGELYILIVLYKEDGICQQKICDHYRINKAAVGRAVHKLEKKHFITKKPDEKDRRKRILSLTEKARKMKPEFKNILRSAEKVLRKDLSDKEIETFLKVSKKISKNIHEVLDQN
ncbi:MAG: MarR family transcriptional regulator [Candidatus Mcinerneyibacterium aminivorans]|uniref:MarR family transcriptional regulator n=1 Tax=Candidatus Mcinerneyibacterium aminivorans TaxID=2703815 RepID=A0A5D0MAQ7_9BACT|nr:MAG: MarR family transcriptional regulator [Candidatus Mcinerneyibacterium aminivorans]